MSPLQTDKSKPALASGDGLTVIVKISGIPMQELAEGVIEMVAETGAVLVFVAVKDAMFPVPFVGNPIEGSLFAQEKVVPETVPVKEMPDITLPLHILRSEILFMPGTGATVIVYVEETPWHPLAAGVTIIVAVIGEVVEFAAAKAEIFPFPLAAIPIEGSVFVQLKVAPATLLVNDVVGILSPLQAIISAGTITVGEGLIVILLVAEVELHPPDAAILLVTV